MKKKILGIALAVALVLSIGAAAYAAAGGFTMSYLPGTSDTVANMPPADSGTGGQAYTVSSTVPQREGYEFIDWTLDYGLKPEEKLYSYTVKHVDIIVGSDGEIALGKVEKDIPEGKPVTEYPVSVDGYTLLGYTIDNGDILYGDSVSLNIDRDNIVITFYYYYSGQADVGG